ncbi:related to STE14 - farnesyl cysteine carboxyl-methyltransferase [Ustilago trichophora]|uniref:Protein-S-isoprenylcysteine O-methyltransferase n=1 Tax=Ustilago trichophora TaxID=86804 RepID=A0A5C3E0L6_9BASI|nr:related to STE14 - farnesyl cysteine carboxyl-methyltransferase [Ustilago trichophora]
MTDIKDSEEIDSSLASSSMPSSPTTSSTTTTSSSSCGVSSLDSHHGANEGMTTTKHGRNPQFHSIPSSSRSWLQWLSDKYTIQYVIPTAYAPAALQISNTVFPLGLLFGLVLPRTLKFLYHTLTFSATAKEAGGWWTLPQLSIYLCSWISFHMLEFTVTASYNPTRLFSDSFLLNNGIHYHIAHLLSLLEFALTAHFYPHLKAISLYTYIGLALILFGQTLRSLAMIHASNNFSHLLAFQKRSDHHLVTTGVYGYTRHPSYVGFTYWALGTQVLLGNKLALVGFIGTLWLFFSRRIRAEEKALVEFFGDEYTTYRKRVPSGLPFIK